MAHTGWNGCFVVYFQHTAHLQLLNTIHFLSTKLPFDIVSKEIKDYMYDNYNKLLCKSNFDISFLYFVQMKQLMKIHSSGFFRGCNVYN